MSGTFEQAFRSQLSSWRESIQIPSSSTSASNSSNFMDRISSLNPFKQNDHIALPTTEPRSSSSAANNNRFAFFSSATLTNNVPPGVAASARDDTVEEPEWFTLSYWDRLLVFGICLLGSIACFALCFFIMPVLALKPRKFAVLWSLGSMLFIISFGVLQGPLNYLKHLLSSTRILFTVAYFGSIILTLVFSIGLKSTLLTILACIMQVVAALWYGVSYFPMGTQSLKFASRIGARQVTNWVNS